jgi:hypothetical protein
MRSWAPVGTVFALLSIECHARPAHNAFPEGGMAMFRKLILTVAVFAFGVTSAVAQYVPYQGPRPYPPAVSSPQVRQGGYWVQFRHPYWREQEFASQPEMANFIRTQQGFGWEVQVLQSPYRYAVRYRLMQWGGSRILPTLPEAQQWAAMLEDQGYEPRIVDAPQ